MQRHHYVPQFYLREWYVPGKNEFWLYCRDDAGRILSGQKSARSVAYHKGLYSIVPEFFGPDTISNEIEEKFLSPLDSAASLVHQKLLTSGLTDLSVEDRFTWSLFVNSLLQRSPSKIAEVKEDAAESAAHIMAKLNEQFAQPKPDQLPFFEKLDLNAMAHNAVLSGMVQSIKNLEAIQHFYDMGWAIIHQPMGQDHFLTGDSPVVVNGATGGVPIHLLSLALSPNCLLVMHVKHEDFDEDFIRTMAILHSPLIVEQTKRYLISSKELLDNGRIKYRKVLNEIFSKIGRTNSLVGEHS